MAGTACIAGDADPIDPPNLALSGVYANHTYFTCYFDIYVRNLYVRFEHRRTSIPLISRHHLKKNMINTTVLPIVESYFARNLYSTLTKLFHFCH